MLNDLLAYLDLRLKDLQGCHTSQDQGRREAYTEVKRVVELLLAQKPQPVAESKGIMERLWSLNF